MCLAWEPEGGGGWLVDGWMDATIAVFASCVKGSERERIRRGIKSEKQETHLLHLYTIITADDVDKCQATKSEKILIPFPSISGAKWWWCLNGNCIDFKSIH